jgi:hypothetical protein
MLNVVWIKVLFFLGDVSAKALIAVLQATQNHGDVKTLLPVFCAVLGERGITVFCFFVK